MIGSLRFAKEEIGKLKRQQVEKQNIRITLIFDYDYDSTVNLVGYRNFKIALDSLGGELTEDNIQKACEMSVEMGMPEGFEMKKKEGFSRLNIITEPFYEEIRIR